MNATFPGMRKAALIRQDPGRPHVLPHLQDGRNGLIMSQPALGSTLSPDIVRDTVERANAWYAKAAYLTQAADNLLTAAGLPLPSREPSVLPPNVFSLTAARARRQAVAR